MTEDQQEVLLQELKESVQSVIDKYNIKLKIFFNKKTSFVKLQEIEKFGLEHLHTNYPKYSHITSFSTRTRIKDIMMHQQAVCLVAHNYMHSKTYIGQYFGRDHSSAINSIKQADNYLWSKDKKFIQIYNFINNKVNNYVGTISNNTENKNNTESMSFVVFNEGENFFTRQH